MQLGTTGHESLFIKAEWKEQLPALTKHGEDTQGMFAQFGFWLYVVQGVDGLDYFRTTEAFDIDGYTFDDMREHLEEFQAKNPYNNKITVDACVNNEEDYSFDVVLYGLYPVTDEQAKDLIVLRALVKQNIEAQKELAEKAKIDAAKKVLVDAGIMVE